jgi:hypothetical protein
VSKEVRQLTRALVEAVLGERIDRDVLRPVLLTMVQTAISDFEKYHDRTHAEARVRDYEMLIARVKEKWSA